MQECIYCSKDERLSNLMIEIGPMQVSTLFLFREQTYRGRCIVALNTHYRELFELPEQLRQAFMTDVARAAKAIQKVMNPDKINYGAYGDKMPHVHFHLVPKYEDDYTWGTTFVMNPPQDNYLTEAEYDELIEKLKVNL